MFGKRGREKEGCLNGVGTYLPGTVMQGACCLSGVETHMWGTVLHGCRPGTVLQGCRLFKRRLNLSARHCVSGCRLFKQCQNLPAGHCVAGLQTV